MWAKFWHLLTTTRYTRRLEKEIEQLKADNARLRADNDGLLQALYPAMRSIRYEPKEHPAVSNLKPFKF
jgi:hypothetical protein